MTQQTIPVINGDLQRQVIPVIPPTGQDLMADSLPVTLASDWLPANMLPATSIPLTGAASTTETVGPFAPQPTRPMMLEIVSEAAEGSVQLMRAIAGGTPQPVTKGGYPVTFALSGTTGVVVNEAIWTPTSSADTYFLALTVTAGSITYDLRQ